MDSYCIGCSCCYARGEWPAAFEGRKVDGLDGRAHQRPGRSHPRPLECPDDATDAGATRTRRRTCGCATARALSRYDERALLTPGSDVACCGPEPGPDRRPPSLRRVDRRLRCGRRRFDVVVVRLADLRKPGYEKSEIHAVSPFGPEPDLWFEVAGTPAAQRSDSQANDGERMQASIRQSKNVSGVKAIFHCRA